MYQNIYVTQRTFDSQSMVYLFDDEQGLIVSPYHSEFGYAYKKDPNGTHVSIYGDKLKKVKHPKWDEPGLFESDLARETRVLTDVYLDSDLPSKGHRILFFDIEVSSEGGFALPTIADKEITAIAYYDKSADHYTVHLLDKDGLINTSTTDNETVISYPTERDLLASFLQDYKKINPTIVSGWNTDSYDIPYLYNRLKRVFDEGIANQLSPVGIIRYSEHRQRWIIAGVSSLDYLPLYKKFTYTQQPSYRLDAIGKAEVGMGKVVYDGKLDDLFKTDLKKFIDYNLTDVKIVVALDNKLKLIELARFICHIGHVPYEDYSYSSRFIEGTIITYLHRKGIICPNKAIDARAKFNTQLESDSNGFIGAFVKEPDPGLYEWVYSLDLQSLYPSILMSLNISPETKIGRIFNYDIDKHMRGEISTYEIQLGTFSTTHMTRIELMNYLQENKITISSNGILYSTKQQGLIPEILYQWFAQRKEYKDLMKQYVTEGNAELAEFYDRRQHVQKILLNCFSPDTEIITVNGVKNITDLKVGDLVYSINPLSLQAEIKPIIKTYEYDYIGDMVSIKSQHVDFLVTPNHNILIRNPGTDIYNFRTAGELAQLSGGRKYLPPHVTLPGTFDVDTIDLKNTCHQYDIPFITVHNRFRSPGEHTKLQPWEYNIDDWLELLGWFISEGSLYSSTPKTFESGNSRGVNWKITISQKSRYREKIEQLLTRMGIEFYSDAGGYLFCSEPIFKLLEIECGRGAYNKKIPSWVFELSPTRLLHLYNGLMWGDGDNNGERYSTASKTLMYDFIRLVLHIGKFAYHTVTNEQNIFRIQVCENRGINPTIVPKKHFSMTPYNGKVYCVEVADNHTILCGRNRKFNWCGQSVYGTLGLPIFRFYDLDNAEAVTATGQDIIKTTAKFINNKYKKLTHIKITLDNQKIVSLLPYDSCKIDRNGLLIIIFAKDLLDTDDLLEINGITISELKNEN